MSEFNTQLIALLAAYERNTNAGAMKPANNTMLKIINLLATKITELDTGVVVPTEEPTTVEVLDAAIEKAVTDSEVQNNAVVSGVTDDAAEEDTIVVTQVPEKEVLIGDVNPLTVDDDNRITITENEDGSKVYQVDTGDLPVEEATKVVETAKERSKKKSS